MTRRKPPAVAALVLAVEHYGRPVTRAELVAMGAGRTIDRAIASGALRRVAPALYASDATHTTPHMRIRAAAAWMPASAHLAGGAALFLLGVEEALGPTVHVATGPHVSGPSPPGVALWRSRAPAKVRVIDGVRVASAAHALIQWWCLRPKPLTPGPALDLLRAGRIDAQEVLDALPTYPRVPSRALLTDIATSFLGGTHSALEYRARHEVFDGHVWAAWEWQAEVRTPGRTARVDMLHRDAKIAVEFDGARYHGNDLKRRDDLERDAVLAGAGYMTIRFTWEDIVNRPAWCRERVREAWRSRARAA